MNKSKKLTAAVAVSAVASALVAPAAYADNHLTDIDGSYAKDAIMELVEKGIINGKGDGMFDPAGKIERQDFAIILAKALMLDVSSAPAMATFSDVPTTHYAFKYVEAAAKAGLIKGEGNGMFGAGSNLSRQDMAVLFVRALGEDVTGKGASLKFADAGEIADYAKDAVAAAVEWGLVSGNPDGTFNPAGSAERQAVALVASKFLKVAEVKATAQLTGATVVDANTVTLTFSKEVEALAAADVKVAAKATGAAATVSTATLSADKKSATVKVASPLASGTTYSVTVGNKTVEFTTAAKAEVAAVTALNLKQLKVEFTEAVDADYASMTSASYYALDDATLDFASADVQADGKTVILTLVDGDQFAQQGAYELTVNNQKSALGTSIEKAVKSFTAFDNTVITAKDVTVVGPNTLKVTFSSPVAASVANTNFTLDNGTVSVYQPEASVNGGGTEYSVNLTVGADLSEGTHTLKVAGVAGLNGLKNVEQSLNFEFKKDTVAPTVAVDSVKLATTASTQAVLKFSEPVAVDTTAPTFKLLNSDIYAVYNGVQQYAATMIDIASDANVIKQGGNVVFADKVVVTFNVALPTGTVNFYVNNASSTDTTKQIKDAWSNSFANVAVQGTLAIDNVKPSVALVKADDQNQVTVEYSEAVSDVASSATGFEYSALNPNNYTFMKEDGSVASGTGLDGAGHPVGTIGIDSDKKVVTFSNLALTGGNYKLKVANVNDTAVPAANKIDEATVAFNVVDTTKPTVSNVLYTADMKTLYVYFDKTMDVASITDLNNYSVNGKILSSLSGNTVTATAINSNSAVKITFSSAFADLVEGNDFFYGRLKDAQGNYTAGLNNEFVAGVKADSITAADILNVKAVAKDTITFEVKQVLASIDITGFWYNSEAIAQAWLTQQKVDDGAVDGTLVTLKLRSTSANMLYTDANNFGTLTINNAAANSTTGKSALTNQNGNGLKNVVTVAATGTPDIAVTTDGVDKIAPKIIGAKTLNENATPNNGAAKRIDTIEVTFSEEMLVSSVGLYSFTVAGYTVTDVQHVGVNGAGEDVFEIKVTEKNYDDYNNQPTVTLVKEAKDSNGNVIGVQTSGVTPVDGVL